MTIPVLRHYVRDELMSSDDATWKVSLPNRGAVHTLFLRAWALNGSTSGHGVNAADIIEEIVIRGDGSDVLFYMTPYEWEKWCQTRYGRGFRWNWNELPGEKQEVVIPIPFGRDVYDPDYYLPLERFRDVTLEVKYNVPVAADGGFESGTLRFDVTLLMTKDASRLGYKGTFVHRTIKRYTTQDSGEVEIEVPTGLTLTAIGNFVYPQGDPPVGGVARVMLEDRSTGETIYDMPWYTAADVFHHLTEVDEEVALLAHIANNEFVRTRVGDPRHIGSEPIVAHDPAANTFYVVSVKEVVEDRVRYAVAQANITAGAEDLTDVSSRISVRLAVEGNAAHYFVPIVFTTDPDQVQPLATNDYGRLTVSHIQDAAGAEAHVSVEEVKRV